MKLFNLFLVALFLFSLGCISETKTSNSDSNVIMSSFFPVNEMVKGVAGDKFTYVSLVPSGIEPHDFEPTSGDLRKLSSTKAFFALGLNFSPFEEKAKENTNSYFEISKNVDTISTNGKTDPHIWLSPKRMKVAVENIKTHLSNIDPQNSQYYSANANSLSQKLDVLDKKFQRGLAFCNKSIILTSHSAFGYLASDYNLTQIGISGLDPETEPTPSQIRELIDVTKREKIKYIFYEDLVDPRVSQTIASEAGVDILELSPLEGSVDNKDYFQMMEDNLENLQIALECS